MIKTSFCDPSKLLPHPLNSNEHSDENIAELAASLETLTQYKNIAMWSPLEVMTVANKSGAEHTLRPDIKYIIAGHGLVLAAIKRGWDKIECKDYTGIWSYDEALLALEVDNAAPLGSQRDPEQMRANLERARALYVDDERISRMVERAREAVGASGNGETPKDPGPQIDKSAELQEKWGTALGQVWQLGDHRLVCGDCTDKAVVKAVMRGERATLFATDPPYGANAGNIGYTAQRDDIETITKDDLEGLEMQAFLERAFNVCIPSLYDNCAWYLWHPMLTQGYFAAAAAAAAADLIIHRQIIWVKEQFIFGRGDYHWRHELCFYGWRKGYRPKWYTERNQDTIWNIPYDGKRSEIGHPTAKPVGLFVKPLENHTKKGDIALEPFCGSGSQLIACEQLNRQCRGIEIEPKYVGVTIQRWVDLTGKEPVLLSS